VQSLSSFGIRVEELSQAKVVIAGISLKMLHNKCCAENKHAEQLKQFNIKTP